MSSNKSIRELMEKKYGKKCMMEEAGIRYIPVEQRRKIKGYKKIDEAITYHHMKRKCKGGQATEENGALLKWYNHSWLEKQSPATRERINNMLRRYKMRFVGLEFTGDGKIVNDVIMDIEEPEEYIEIPLYPNKEEKMINDPKLIQATLEELDKVSFEQLDKAIKKADEEESVNPDDVIRARMEEVWYK